MADQRTQENQLQPALLDRLTDNERDKKLEPRHERVIPKRRMREAVLRDLAWLFNTTRPNLTKQGMTRTAMPQAWRSVINYGLSALSGQTASTIDIVSLEREIRQVILDFEPRILPDTLTVKAVEANVLDQHNVIGIQITGQLWAQPVPLELLVRTEIDVETGQVHVKDLNPSRGA